MSRLEPRNFRFLAKMLALATLSAMVAAGAFFAAWLQEAALAEARFDAVTDEAVAMLENRLGEYDQTLLSGVALLNVHRPVTRGEWRRFFLTLDVFPRNAGLQGVGLSLKVPYGGLSAHEKSVRGEGFPAYRVEPPGDRDVYFPIIYLEPFSGRNLRAFGFDMWSEPVRHAAMAAAAAGGRAAMSGPVTLVQETGQDVQHGVLIYEPFYDHAGLAGFVYAPIRLNDLFDAVLGSRLHNLCLAVRDRQAEATGPIFTNSNCHRGHFFQVRLITVFGRQWEIRAHSSRELDRSIGSGHTGILDGLGALVGVLLAWLIAGRVAERRKRLALAGANRELAAAREMAEHANQSKSRFLAAASHDLRQPLQTLGIYLHLWSEKSSADLAKFAAGALKSFDATQRLLNSIMDIAALESGRFSPRLSSFDAAELLADIAREIRPEAEAKGLGLRLRLRPARVRTDPVMLERVVRNIVHNALKYTETGAILLACARSPSGVRIKIADSGPGIPKDKQALIFEEFYQLGNSERDPRKGLGLGLATAARISRLLGYGLDLYSQPCRGSSFVVVVPADSTEGEG